MKSTSILGVLGAMLALGAAPLQASFASQTSPRASSTLVASSSIPDAQVAGMAKHKAGLAANMRQLRWKQAQAAQRAEQARREAARRRSKHLADIAASVRQGRLKQERAYQRSHHSAAEEARLAAKHRADIAASVREGQIKQERAVQRMHRTTRPTLARPR